MQEPTTRRITKNPIWMLDFGLNPDLGETFEGQLNVARGDLLLSVTNGSTTVKQTLDKLVQSMMRFGEVLRMENVTVPEFGIEDSPGREVQKLVLRHESIILKAALGGGMASGKLDGLLQEVAHKAAALGVALAKKYRDNPRIENILAQMEEGGVTDELTTAFAKLVDKETPEQAIYYMRRALTRYKLDGRNPALKKLTDKFAALVMPGF